LQDLDFIDIRETARFDTFAGTSKEKAARSFGVEGANFFARRPLANGVGG